MLDWMHQFIAFFCKFLIRSFFSFFFWVEMKICHQIEHAKNWKKKIDDDENMNADINECKKGNGNECSN